MLCRIPVRYCCLFALLLLLGCSESKDKAVPVTGKLVDDGQPVKVDIGGANLPPGEDVGRMLVTFYAVKSEEERLVDQNGESLGVPSHTADLEGDGRFTIIGPSGDGIPPGKYRVVITHKDPLTGKDVLGGKFNEVNSKIHRDITAESGEIVIDLADP